jgi:hypothetical protein
MNVRSLIDQELNHGSMSLIGGPHHRRRSAKLLGCIQSCTALHQQLDGIQLSRSRRHHQSGLAVRQDGSVRIRARLK